MEIGGYAGQDLYVDLTTGAVKKQKLDPEVAKNFIGGSGMGSWLAYELIKPHIDPLSPDNHIIISAGPLLGTPLPAASETACTTKYPLTGSINPGKAGGRLGPLLKYAGYDNLIINGKSKKPVYLKICDDDVELCDATDIWGKDVHTTTDILWSKHGEEYCVVPIGPAGENLVKISLTIVDKLQTMGKGGLGATMGSKNLKAILIKGTKGIKVNDNKFQQFVFSELRSFMNDPLLQPWLDLGSMFFFNSRVQWYHKNYTEIITNEQAQRYGPSVYKEVVHRHKLACMACPGSCKAYLELKDEEFKGTKLVLSTVGGRIPHFMNRTNAGSINRAIILADLCNKYGLCAHNATSLIDFLVELYEKKIITEKDTGGQVLKRDFEMTKELIKKIASREGIGNTIAEGYNGVIKEIGRGCEKYAVQVKGLDVNFDARINRLGTLEFHEVVNPRGGHQQVALTEGGAIYAGDSVEDSDDVEKFRQWCDRVNVPKDARDRIFEKPGQFNVAKLTKWSEDWWTLIDSMGWGCYYHKRTYTMDKICTAYALATGIHLSSEELLRAAERSYNVLKAANAREGFSRKDDAFPEKWFEPILDEGKPRYMMDQSGNLITKEVVSRLLDAYYAERGWDIVTGIPTKSKLTELGLERIAKELYPV